MQRDGRTARTPEVRVPPGSSDPSAGTRTTRPLGSPGRWLLSGVAALGYALVFPVAFDLAGRGAYSLSLAPIVAVAWLTGVWGGLAGGVLMTTVTIALVFMLGDGFLIVRENPPLEWVIPFSAVTLLGGFVGYTRDLREKLRRQQEILRRLATRDPLTDVLNRRAFANAMERMLDRPGLHAMVYIDLDGFKSVNDTYGHATGDRLLTIIAERLQSAVRPKDVVGRIGGDEFVLGIADLTDTAQADAIAERIQTTLHGTIHIHGHSVNLSGSAGIALTSGNGTTPEELLRAADQAMYATKLARANARRLPHAPHASQVAHAPLAWGGALVAPTTTPARSEPGEAAQRESKRSVS